MAIVNACLSVEERLHEWAIRNLNKINDRFWWKIKQEFLQEALRTTGVTQGQYSSLIQEMQKRHGESTGCD